MTNPTERLMQLRAAAKTKTTRARSTVERVAGRLGVSFNRPGRRFHCACPPYGEPDKDCVGFQCHQLTDRQKSVVLDALRDQPLLFHAFTMNAWSDADHLKILERVDAYIEQTRDQQATQARQLLEHPHGL
jgi:hypothetical protein